MKGLQKVISSKLDNTICTNFLQSRELRDAQRILSAAAKFGGTWKTVLPSSPDLTLSDEDYRNAAKIGLGLPCQNDLPDKCDCGEELIKDPAHFLSCRRLKRPAMSTRHDWIVNLLAKIFRELGAVVHVEPRIFDYERVRPDLDILFPHCQILIDVTVAHPNSPSRKSSVQLAAATAAEARKTRHYAANAKLGNGVLRAFAVETFGGFGHQATEIIKLIQSQSHSNAENQIRSIAIALQKGNAHVMKQGAIASRVAAL